MNCPNCGFPVFTGGWQKREYKNLDFGAETIAFPERTNGFVVPAGMKWEKKMPAREANMQSDVFVPLAQSLVTGLCAGVGCGAIWDISIGVIVGAIATGLCWLVLANEHRRSLWITEEIEGIDLDGDGEIGEPTTTRIEVDITNDKQKQRVILDLGIPQDKLVTFAKGILAGKSTSVNTWAGSGKLFSDTEFDNLRDELIARRLAHWKNPEHHNLGWKFNKVGFRVLCRVAE